MHGMTIVPIIALFKDPPTATLGARFKGGPVVKKRLGKVIPVQSR
jgi:hypothetical protein